MSRYLLLCLALAMAGRGGARDMSLVLVTEAVKEGAMCLDGSAPGYYIGKGSGSGVDKWIVHQGGGGWCYTESECLGRSKTVLGTSTMWKDTTELEGIFSENETVNEEFYNWNVVYLMYCDGASFSGYRAGSVVVGNTSIYFRGKLILLALIQDLLKSGMDNATDVILTGCSAGGLATYLHADLVATLLPKGVKYRAMADAGYFLDIPNTYGQKVYSEGMHAVYNMQNTSGGSNQRCVVNYTGPIEFQCIFAPYSFPFIETPIFIINSLYDTAQITGILGLDCLPYNCDAEQMKLFDNFRNEFLEQLTLALKSSSTGIYADSCLIHCQTLTDEPWAGYRVGGQSMRETFANWYVERSSTHHKVVDCPFPCNPTCPACPSVPKRMAEKRDFPSFISEVLK